MLVAANARESVLHLLPHDGNGMEIGVWRGAFSARILQVAQKKVLHLVDPWRTAASETHGKAWYGSGGVTQEEMDQTFEAVTKRFAAEIATNRVVVHRVASAEALQKIPDETMDFVYIDGDHMFEAVLADLKSAFRTVKAGGLICGDDYALGSWWKDGVVRALHQFVATHAVIVQLVMGTQFVLRKSKG